MPRIVILLLAVGLFANLTLGGAATAEPGSDPGIMGCGLRVAPDFSTWDEPRGAGLWDDPGGIGPWADPRGTELVINPRGIEPMIAPTGIGCWLDPEG